MGVHAEHLISTFAVEQRPARHRREQWDITRDRGRPHDSVRTQMGRRERADDVELVVDLHVMPLAETQVPNDDLLPLALVGFRCVGEAPRDRHRVGETVSPRDVGRDGEHGRRVPPAGEGDTARRALEGTADDLLEHRRGPRTGLGSRSCAIAVVAHLPEDVAEHDLRRTHHVHRVGDHAVSLGTGPGEQARTESVDDQRSMDATTAAK